MSRLNNYLNIITLFTNAVKQMCIQLINVVGTVSPTVYV